MPASEHRRRFVEKHKLAGLCVRCSEPARPGLTCCTECAAKAEEYRKLVMATVEGRQKRHEYEVQYFRARKLAGKCRSCAQPARENRALCQPCAEKHLESLRKWKLAHLPATCKCGAPRATVNGFLCRRCALISEKRRMAGLMSQRASHEGGFVVFRLGRHAGQTFRIIDIAAERENMDSALDFLRLHSRDEDTNTPTFDEGDDWRNGEVRLGASVPYWLDPKDHLPPSWERD